MKKRTSKSFLAGFLAVNMLFTQGLSAGPLTVSASANQENPITETQSNQVKSEIPAIDQITGETSFITSDAMKVLIDEKFPRVIQYELLEGGDAGKRFYGQTDSLTTMKINDCVVTPEVTSEVTADKVVYTITVNGTFENSKKENVEIDTVLTAQLQVIDNTVEFRITNIVDNKIVKTIEFPNQNLISVRSTQPSANLQGANMSTNTHIQGDRGVLVDENLNVTAEALKGYMYAFISDDTLSAGLWSNSENKINSDWQSVTATAHEAEGYKEIGLSSTYWTYQKSEEHRKQDGTYEMENGGVLTMDSELPCVKVVIASDANEDNKINWQDGAVEYRKIMNQLNGGETVPDLVAYRIAMNFGSQAQNPFLMTLDNVKKVYLHTEGLGQSILLKGYGSEGHDSGHLNYADIGKRIGGAQEMKTLLEKSKQYGATFGIHVNASETYPESIYFTEDRLLKKADGTYSYGWNWIDQGININADYDLRNGRAQRFYDLYQTLGGADNNLDFIYVDVWGNGQSGDNGTWASSQLSKEIKSLGWRVAGEWGYAFANESTFQHWAADLTYGGYSLKGINSTITRFLYNDQKDSWVAHYPSYGGAAEQPLLGGYNMKDFEGWQGRSDYAAYMSNLYNVNVPSKFLQHYDAMTWETGTPVSMSDNGQTYNWTPDMKATLKDAAGNEIEINRLSNDYANEKELYRSRSIKYNNVEILNGSETNQRYLIPWFWDQNGKALAESEQKLYHWNTHAGETTWTLPSEWAGVTELKMYELTDLGKVDEQTVAVTDGAVTLTAKANTPYVLHKGVTENKDVTWSDGMHIVDSGYNSGNLDAWGGEKTNAEVVRSQGANQMLAFNGEGTVTQTLTDLTPGQQYAVYVGVDNRSDAKAYITVNAGGVESTNYTNRSIARNYIKAYAHNTNRSTSTVDNTSYFQNMYVYFTAPATGDVVLTLGREAGDGISYFDDVRIAENEAKNETLKGDRKVFTQDFENVAQGAYPFVIGDIEGVEDNRTHLSEKHAPYTQVGWNGKQVDDVIVGDWSLKTNGLTSRNKLVYRTIPQNFRFEPGKTYNVSFKYEAGSDDIYALAIGDGDVSVQGNKFDIIPLPGTVKNENDAAVQGARAVEYKFMLDGSQSGQTWFGIYSTNVAPEIPEGTHADFGGYKDFVLDELVIEESPAVKTELGTEITASKKVVQENYSKESVSKFVAALTSAQEVFDNLESTQVEVDKAKTELVAKRDALVRTGITISGTITDDEGENAPKVTVTVSATGKEDKTATTNANGVYTIHGVTFGEYTIKADSIAYETTTDTITSADGDNADLTKDFVVTQAKTTLKGIVTSNNKPVEGANVEISYPLAGSHMATTGEDGAYEFTDVVVKDYNVTVTKDGYDGLTVVVPTTKLETTNKTLMIQIASTVDYINEFTNGVTALQNLSGNTSSTTIAAVDGGAKISFPGGGHSNVVEEVAGKMQDGVIEVDVTPLDGVGTRFGILLRANNMNSRIYVGAGDNNGQWFAEYWHAGGNAWSSMFSGPTINQGEKVHLKAEVIGKGIKLWVNDQLVIETVMTVPLNPGYVGFTRRASGSFLVDNLAVTSYDAPSGESQTISGDVKVSDGTSAEGLKVDLKQGRKVIKTTTVGALGAYKFKKVPFGDYTVVVRKDGKTGTKDVKVGKAEFYVVVDEINVDMDQVVETVDKTELEAQMEIAKAFDEKDYTKETFAVLTKAIGEVQEILEDVDATKEEIANALEVLKSAISQLEKLKNGWVKEAKGWMYYENHTPIKSKWLNDKEYKGWFYFDANGYMATEWEKVKGSWYYLGKDGKMTTGWQKVKGTWYFLEDSGKMLTGWQKVKGTWYLLADNGKMLTGWQKVKGTWYLLADNGKMLTGWQKVSGTWYYLNSNGTMKTGWLKDKGQWYYLNASGKMQTGWVKDGGSWYYMANNGMMQTGWVLVKGTWYYLNANGKMATGWTKVGKKSYYLSTVTGAWNGKVKNN